MKVISTIIFTLFSCVLIAQINSLDNSMAIHPIKIDKKWGFMSDTGQVIIEPQYDAYRYEKYNYTLVEKEGKIGILNPQGMLILPIKYQRIRPLNENTFAVMLDTLEIVVNEKNERLLSKEYQHIELLNQQFFATRVDSLWGIHKRGGQAIVPPIYDKITALEEGKGYFMVYQKEDLIGLAGLMDLDGKLISDINYLDFTVVNDSLFLFKNKDNLWGLMNREGTILHEPDWMLAEPLNPYLMVVKLKDKKNRAQLLSISTRQIIELESSYSNFQPFNNLYILAVRGYRKGLLDTLGNQVLKPEFHNIEPTQYRNMFRVQVGSWGLYDKDKDSIVLETINNLVHPFKNKVAIFIMGGLYGLVNYKGKVLLPGIYDKIEIIDNIVKTSKLKERNVLRITEEAELVLDNNFQKVKRLRIGGNGTQQSDGSATSFSIDRMAVGPYRWRMQNGRYGVYDNVTRQFVVSPRFRYIYPAQEAGVTLVTLVDTLNLSGLKDYNNRSNDAIYKVGLFSHTSLQLLPIRSDIIGIRYSDFRRGAKVAAFIDTLGRCGLIEPSGRIVAYDSSYQFIGYVQNGLARVYSNGKLIVGIEKGYRGNPAIGSTASTIREFGIDYIENRETVRGTGFLLYEGGQWGYLDDKGNMKIASDFVYANDFKETQVINRKTTGWGMTNMIGEDILDYKYTKIESFQDIQLLKTQIQSKAVTSLNNKGNTIFTKYERQGKFVDGLCKVAIMNQENEIRWGYINQNLEEVIPLKYQQAKDFSNGWAIVADSTGWLFIDAQGNVALRLHKAIKEVGNFHEDLAWVKAGTFYGYIDRTGTFILKPKYHKADDFTFQVARVFIGKRAAIIDKNGEFVVPPTAYKTIKPISKYGVAVVQKNERRLMGMIDYNGKVILPLRYDQVSHFNNGVAIIRQLGKFGFIDSTCKVIIEPKFERVGNPREGLIAVSKLGKADWFYIDYSGKQAIPTIFYEAGDFKYGFAVVRLVEKGQSPKTALIDQKGKVHYVSTPKKILTGFGEGIRNIKQSIHDEEIGKSRYIHYFTDANNQPLFERDFREIAPFEQGVAFVVTIDGWGALNRRGFMIIRDKYVRLIRQNETIIRGKAPYFHGFVTDKGEIIHPPIFDYVRRINRNLYKVERNSKVGYINRKGEWIWELKG